MGKKLVDLKTRIKENFIKNKVLLIVFIVIWAIVVSGTLFINSSTLGKEPIGNQELRNTLDLDNKTKIVQILPLQDGSENISIKYGTYIRNNKGNVYITVKGTKSNKIYADTKTNVKTIQDNAYITYSLNEKLDSKIDDYIEITLTSDSVSGSCVGIYVTSDKYYEDSELYVNGSRKYPEIGFKYLIDNDTYLTFSNAVVTAVIISLTLIILMMLLIEPKMEVLITTLVLVLGLIFACIMSPGAIPDEPDHYEHSLQVSNIMMFKKNNEIDKAYVNYDSFGSFINANYSYNRFMRDMNKPLELKDKIYLLQKDTDDIYKHYYLPYYVPQAVGITLARLCNVNTLRTFYSGRVSNLVFYAICIYIAIKNTPSHKLLFGILSILPIFIQQAASYSYDGFINGLTFVTIAFFLKWKFKEETISTKDIVIVFITSLALAPAKIVYSIFALLFWFIPKERFGSEKRWLLSLLLISLPAIIIVLVNIWWRIEPMLADSMFAFRKVYADTLGSDTGYEHRGGYTYSTTFILQNPMQTIQIIYRTVRFWLSTWFYQSIGKALAGVTLILPMSYIRVILVIIAAAALRKEDYHLPIIIKLAFVAVCLIMAMFIILGMLYGWTLTTDTMIQGIQGRYFCPLLPYFFSIFNNTKIYLPKKIDKYVIYSYILIIFEIIIYILSYTFVN